MKDYAQHFYKGRAWQKVSRLYMSGQNYVCERCGGAGVICHHKTYITPENINDPAITLNPDNLECLCQDCHNKEHKGQESRAIFDESGRMIGVKESKELAEYREAVKSIERLTRGARIAPHSPQNTNGV